MPSLLCFPSFLACNRQVDFLDRRQCNLQQIPGDIERYARSLEELLLDMNHIRDLPKSLFRLHKLQRLGLSDNDIHRLPPEVASLQNLVELNLSRNDISDLPEDLKVCQHLRMLDISSNPIARLPDSITMCTSLTHLALNDISLTKLPQDVGAMAALKSLEARENHLRTLPTSIAELVNLQRLDLGQNELDDLPSEIGSLRSLQELYVDENSLEKLPDTLLHCTRLEQLDTSSNRLFQLPEELGELTSLLDLTVSHNCLRELPNSIGRLKKLAILKADDNTIDSLTPAIGSCTALNELYLQQNLIAELPSSIGNLQALHTLNLDRCQLRRLPALIGECHSLTVLSVRDNQLEELPMEVGKLARLRVLDVCNNRMAHLPYTINVLRELQALWLSENQSQALLRLQQDTDPRTGIKVLTCYLLPQQETATADGNGTRAAAPPLSANKAFVGGPKVHFGGEEGHEEGDQSDKGQQFERKNTPHPKTQSGTEKSTAAGPVAKHHQHSKKLDGHVLPRMEEHPQSIVLSAKKASHDHSVEATSSGQSEQMPRSALKYSSRGVIQQQQTNEPVTDTAPEPQKQPNTQVEPQKTVFFANNSTATSAPNAQTECRLKRVNTPHYKSQRAKQQQTAPASGPQPPTTPSAPAEGRRQLQSTPSDGMHIQDPPPAPSSFSHLPANNANASQGNSSSIVIPSSSSSFSSSPDRMRVFVRRGDQQGAGGGLGLTIAGGIESTPFVDDDPGLFISKLVPGGAAERTGLRVGDKVLEINGQSMVGQRHQVAVQGIQQSADGVELFVERQRKKTIGGDADRPNATHSSTSSHQPVPHHNSTPPTTSPHYSSSQNTLFSPLPAKSAPFLAADLSFGDSRLDGCVEELELVRDSKNSLGLSIVGGVDHCSHPFGSASNPGVFISRIAPNSPAEGTRRLRIGDRILRVNELDISLARHHEAVEALKNTGRSLRVTIRHEQQPKGLRVVLVCRRDNQPLGLSICGGIGSTPVNPEDKTDEGIFIERVESGGPAEESAGGLTVGMRILEVNDGSLLGCTKEEAAQLFRTALPGPVRLLVCEGFGGDQRQRMQSSPSSPTNVGLALVGHMLENNNNHATSGHNNNNEYQNIGIKMNASHSASAVALSAFSPSAISNGKKTAPDEQKVPDVSRITTFPSEPLKNGDKKIPPPVAPKPKNITNFDATPPPQSGEVKQSSAELDDFSSRLRLFQQQSRRGTSAGAPNPPEKRPLLSNDDLAKLAEDDRMRRDQKREENGASERSAATGISPMTPGDGTANAQFEHILNNSPIPLAPSVASIHTKKAENRFLQQLNNPCSPLPQPCSPIGQMAVEQQKRSEWRQARMASLEAESLRANQLISDVSEITKGSLADEHRLAGDLQR